MQSVLRQLLIWRIWRAVRPQHNHNAIYGYAQGSGYGVPHILEAGFVWTLLICRALSREHDRATFALLAMTPPGALGAGLLICAGVMHRLIEITQYLGLLVWIVRFLVVGIWLGGTAALTETLPEFCLLWVGVVLPVVALAALHIYDLSLAVVLGMLFPSLVQERTATPVFAMILHVFLLMVPMLQAVVVYSASRAVTESVLVFLLLNAANLAFMIAICEGTVRALWRQLVRALDISPADTALLTG